ncbi:class I SAM-dependent methyltransferase [Nonomuraea soli]|uniref:SAM-dependent methyltransferase n=1 Tax=Nonomuraea soli TaxID=1032476 RepID=A0A7W0HN42_9ACTN|nr:class I SAM-dependent methyltransferase [Nonomuraea soli]MBA2889121.1 SAM-dependent methyltransferase [Nonomuraea soli]
MTDHYSVAVPFYDLWHDDGHVPDMREKLPSVLSGVRRSVLEIGAGTGRMTEVIAAATPAEIFAVEPSLGMRGVLLSRLADRPDLMERVTVLPYDALSVELDEPVEAVVMIAVLYTFSAAERAKLWQVLARQLEPGGLLVFNWRERPVAEPGELEQLDTYRVGRHDYEIWAQTLTASEELSTARFLYRIRHRGVVISEDEVVSSSHRPGLDALTAELTAAGFVPGDAPEGLLTWRLRK